MATKEYKTLQELLTTATVDEIFTARGKVIEIDSKATVEHGFQTLVDNHILSAPVYDSEKKSYVGFVDMNDFISFVIRVYKEKKEAIEKENFRTIIAQSHRFSQETITNIADLSRTNPFHCIPAGSSLLEATRLLAGGIHRLPVVKNGRVVNVLSQSSVVHWLAIHVDHIKEDPKLHKTIAELHLGLGQIVALPQNAKLIEVLTTMHEQKVSAVGINAENGTLSGVFSNYDIKAFVKTPNFPDLIRKTALQFVSANRQMEVEARSTVIDTNVDTIFSIVIKKLAATQVHRIFITKDLKPLGVISLTDVLQEVLKS